jgi:hypothetical protein
MSMAARVLLEREQELERQIETSKGTFDLTAPLTDEELAQAGMLFSLPGSPTVKVNLNQEEMPLLQEIEDVEEAPVDAVEGLTDRQDYNVQYVRYMRCQAITALAAFTEGWSAFEELALKAFVKQAKFEDERYRGEDPHKAFSLRVRRQAAEDFFRFIRQVVSEAQATPKPSLAAK